MKELGATPTRVLALALALGSCSEAPIADTTGSADVAAMETDTTIADVDATTPSDTIVPPDTASPSEVGMLLDSQNGSDGSIPDGSITQDAGPTPDTTELPSEVWPEDTFSEDAPDAGAPSPVCGNGHVEGDEVSVIAAVGVGTIKLRMLVGVVFVSLGGWGVLSPCKVGIDNGTAFVGREHTIYIVALTRRSTRKRVFSR